MKATFAHSAHARERDLTVLRALTRFVGLLSWDHAFVVITSLIAPATVVPGLARSAWWVVPIIAYFVHAHLIDEVRAAGVVATCQAVSDDDQQKAGSTMEIRIALKREGSFYK